MTYTPNPSPPCRGSGLLPQHGQPRGWGPCLYCGRVLPLTTRGMVWRHRPAAPAPLTEARTVPAGHPTAPPPTDPVLDQRGILPADAPEDPDY